MLIVNVVFGVVVGGHACMQVAQPNKHTAYEIYLVEEYFPFPSCWITLLSISLDRKKSLANQTSLLNESHHPASFSSGDY